MKNNVCGCAACASCCCIAAAFSCGCSPQELTAMRRPSNGRQRDADGRPAPEHLRLYTVAPSKFHKTIETTGVVDFDNDQATSVLAPFSGPVSRLLVSLGDQVKQGRSAGGGGFARLCGGRQRLSQGARHRQDRPPAGRSGQGSGPASRRLAARSGPGGNRRRQRRGRPRRGPAGARLAECSIRRPSRTFRKAARLRAPRA